MANPFLTTIQAEMTQAPDTRRPQLEALEGILGKTVVAYHTSTVYPVVMSDEDAVALERLLQGADLSNGIALVISSRGGSPLVSERIAEILRRSSGTGTFDVIVPSKAESAAIMVCLGAELIYMTPAAELGPIDPQLRIIADGKEQVFSVFSLIISHEELFADAAIRNLLQPFLTPEIPKTHGRAIYRESTKQAGFRVECLESSDANFNPLMELHTRPSNFVATRASKSMETRSHQFAKYAPRQAA
jgi:hypothetical protein